MKVLSIVLVIACVSAALAQKTYTNKYDHINVDQILANNRVLTNYIKCLMDEGPCTAEGRELKKTLPDALSTGCDKCSDKQKATAEKVIKHLIDNRENDWNRLTKKYDPSGVYKQRYETELKKTVQKQ